MNETGPAESARDEPGGALFPGDGEMVRRMRAHPWADSGLADTTQRVVGERRMAALQYLGSLAGRARSAAEAAHLVARL